LFIVGMPRSGTKLLRDLLNGHPAIGIPEAETEFLPELARTWPEHGDLRTPAAWSRFTARMAGSAYFVYLREERGLALDSEAWRQACPRFDLAGVFEGLCRLHGGASEEGVWGDKSPGYIAHLGLLRALWPGCRLVHIVRDPRDHVLSMRKAWGKDPVRAAVRWQRRVTAADAELASWGEDALTLRYEDLVRSPESSLRAACGLVELDFRPGMLALARPSENLGDTAGRTSVVASNVEKWRQEDDQELMLTVAGIAREGLVRFGYPTEGVASGASVPSPLELRARQLGDGARLVQFDLDQRGLTGALRFRWRLFRETGAWDG
jgi:hypothetical protein